MLYEPMKNQRISPQMKNFGFKLLKGVSLGKKNFLLSLKHFIPSFKVFPLEPA